MITPPNSEQIENKSLFPGFYIYMNKSVSIIFPTDARYCGLNELNRSGATENVIPVNGAVLKIDTEEHIFHVPYISS